MGTNSRKFCLGHYTKSKTPRECRQHLAKIDLGLGVAGKPVEEELEEGEEAQEYDTRSEAATSRSGSRGEGGAGDRSLSPSLSRSSSLGSASLSGQCVCVCVCMRPPFRSVCMWLACVQLLLGAGLQRVLE